ncbi:sugar ABC transporter substrate-binding protein [Haloarcula salinisoli]|uniref:Sugar ABC transporter substrate-binding protein n=1 Tax=Haloarcula salinisoli TaxID=2487746 RepID=A0A8J7YNG8_9EURY|nr:sugar ABC transporter substrate-binding protein [Halomicroarcula salinisoli]MBX0288631.1 sugar ABC transporter substrate-binding protein [Halomicroarcula salinisoli]MBX0305989.1 sugar ABC transporter substrate-binding protein [Halomicroarcula salinisoli]
MTGKQSRESRRSFINQLAGTAGLAAMASLAGCGGSSGSGDDSLTSMGSIANRNNSYWLSWEKGYLEAAEAFGYETNVQTNNGEVSTQQQQFDTAVSNNTDFIAGQTYTNAAAITLAETLAQSGTPGVLAVTIADWFVPQDAGEEYVTFFTPHFVNHAYSGAKMLFEAMGGSGTFVHIEGNRGTAPNIGRNKGVDLALEEYPDIEMAGSRQPGNFIRSDARSVMSDKVSEFGDDIDGFFGQNDAVALGGLTILEENDIDVPVVGIDASEPGLAAIANDRMLGTVSGMGPWQAGWSVAKCHDYINGHTLSPAEKMMSFNAPVCTKNPGEWQDVIERLPVVDAAEYNDAIFSGETPYDWTKMSVVEAGEDAWDPQIDMSPMNLEDMREVLDWEDGDKPSGYSLPGVYTDSATQEETTQLYEDQFQTNPLQ